MAPLGTGNILIVSDQLDVTTGFAAEISAVDGSTVQTLSMAFANKGDILPSGIFCLAVETVDDDPLESFSIYDNLGNLITAVTSIVISPQLDWACPVSAWGTATFYVLANLLAGGDPTLYTISDVGVVGGTSWVLPSDADGARSIAVSIDGSILYYRTFTGSAIKRYDLIGLAPLSDLIGSAIYFWGYGLFVMDNGNIVAMGIDGSNLDNVVVLSDAGAVIAAYPFDLDNYEVGELFSDPDQAFIWIRSFPDGSGATSTFKKVALATGTADPAFTVGTLEGAGVVPSTCPMLLLRNGSDQGDDGNGGIIGPLAWVHWPRRVPGATPPGSP